MPDWAAVPGTVAVLLLPSVAWSLVYREPKLVLDVVPLYALECWLAPSWRVFLRVLWILACAWQASCLGNFAFDSRVCFALDKVGVALRHSLCSFNQASLLLC